MKRNPNDFKASNKIKGLRVNAPSVYICNRCAKVISSVVLVVYKIFNSFPQVQGLGNRIEGGQF